MNIVGISCYYHDSAACLIRDGRIVAAAQEERFSRKKHDPRFPIQAFSYCLQEGRIAVKDIDYVVYYDKPFLSFERILLSVLSAAPLGLSQWLQAMPEWLGKKLNIPKMIRKETGYSQDVLFTEHHEAHAASAFYPSPFEEAAILTIDGVGEWATAAYGIGHGNELTLLKELHFPHSVGLLYSAFTYFTGFRVNSGEYKLMGLAPYGSPKYKDIILKNLVDVKDDGSIRLNLDYFDYVGGMRMTNNRFSRLFDGPPRKPESKITRREMDLAASIQEVTEEIVMKIVCHVHRETGMKNLCLAGGVALNCVCNGKILRSGPFSDIWIQPAAGDAGGALGAALSVWHRFCGNKRIVISGRDSQAGSYLGPSFSNDYIQKYLNENNLPAVLLTKANRAETIARHIADGKIVGYFEGRMEFGPRSLGARSILADARRMDTQEVLNLKIKYRESFRPFAPAVLEEKAAEYFDLDRPSPYMLLVAQVIKARQIDTKNSNQANDILGRLKIERSDIPAVTHLDYSARVQTVNNIDKPDFHSIIEAFYLLTGFAVIVNTSFNVRGEPIVCTPKDAYRCFMRTEMDVLVLEDFMLVKQDQPVWAEEKEWQRDLILD